MPSTKQLLACLALGALLATSCSPPAPLPKKVSGATPSTVPERPSPHQVESLHPSPSTPRPEVSRPSPRPTRIAGNEIEKLSAEIVASHQTERAKAQALYEWVAKNIRYDIDAYNARDLPNPAPLNVLATRSGVCEGYARLYVALAEAAGLESVMISGFSKGFSPDVVARANEPDHAWCAVRFEGEWHLLDPTWGAGHISQSGKFEANPTLDWFAVQPEQFVTSHLPEEERWQLLSPARSSEEFWSHPSVSSLYFRYGLKVQDQTGDTIRLAGNSELHITTQRECRLMARVFRDGQEIEGEHTLVERRGKEFRIAFSTPAAGSYRLVIFAGELDTNRAESALVYNLESSSAGRSFPQTLQSFTDEQVRLISPRAALRSGESTELVLEAPGASALMAVIANEQLRFEKSGERFTLALEPRGEKVTVYGNYDGGNQYSGLLEFSVR